MPFKLLTLKIRVSIKNCLRQLLESRMVPDRSAAWAPLAKTKNSKMRQKTKTKMENLKVQKTPNNKINQIKINKTQNEGATGAIEKQIKREKLLKQKTNKPPSD